MRKLNTEDFADKLSEYSSDIEYSDRVYLHYMFIQFWNFLHDEPVGTNIL